jgi:FKBP-type peptidyl-prolyl cis-trans isomerase
MRSFPNWGIPFLGLLLMGCHQNASPSSTDPSTPATSGGSTPSAPVDQLKTVDVKTGTGPAAKAGDKLSVTYTGSLKNGSVFDTNAKPDGKPFPFQLGAGTVIKGWDQGMVGMKVGGERKLYIPPALGYGAQGQGEKIPPNSELIFDVKLLSITNQEDAQTVQANDTKVGAGPALKKGDEATITFTTFKEDGSVDNDTNAKKPFSFKVGAMEVVPGIDVGIVGMKAGGVRVLIIPVQFGPRGPGMMSGTPTKVEVHLVSIKPGK